jgi:TRAP-type transport system periplasmic protein
MRTHLLATVAIVLATAGCTAESVDRSGGVQTETLVLASNDGINVGAPGVAHFVERVAKLSAGRLQIDVRPDWGGGGNEARVLTDVAAGKADLAWSGTRAFDQVGINAFRPLHAPFLINSYAAQAAVVVDPMVKDLLAATNPAGLTGLALLADELRFPAGARGPLVSPEDFKRLPFGTLTSAAQAAGLSALGADVKMLGRQSGSDVDGLGGLETMWWTYASNAQQLTFPFVTENAALWARTTVIVANTDRFGELDAADQDVLRRAAAEATAWSVEHASDRVSEERQTACAIGARIVTATPGQLADLRMMVEPAYEAIRADPEQARTLAAIERTVATVKAEPRLDLPGCAYRPGDEERVRSVQNPQPIDAPGQAGKLPAGTYRYAVTEEEVMTYGLTNEEGARANAGVWTWTIGNGSWRYEIEFSSSNVPKGYGGNTCEGFYDVRGKNAEFTRETVHPPGECAPPTWRGVWETSEKGLRWRMSADEPDIVFLFGGKEWVRIS